MMGNPLEGLMSALLTIFIVGLVIVSSIVGITVYFITNTNEIVSETLIKPELKLVVKDNIVDTLYVYKKTTK